MLERQDHNKTGYNIMLSKAKKSYFPKFQTIKVDHLEDRKKETASYEKIINEGKKIIDLRIKYNSQYQSKKSTSKGSRNMKFSSKYNEREFISKKGKKILIIRKAIQKQTPVAPSKTVEINQFPQRIAQLVKSKNKVYGLEYFSPLTKQKHETRDSERKKFYTTWNRFHEQQDKNDLKERKKKIQSFSNSFLTPNTNTFKKYEKQKEPDRTKKKPKLFNGFKTVTFQNANFRSKTQQFNQMKDKLCGWESTEYDFKNIFEFNNIVQQERKRLEN